MKEDFEETTKERLEESGVLDANGGFVGVGSAIKAYFPKNVQGQVSNLPSPQTLEEIQENFQALGEILSTKDAYNALESETFEAAQLSRRAELVSKYTFLYRQAGTETTVLLRNKITAIREVVQISTDGVKQSDRTSSSTRNLEQLRIAAKGIWKQQGKTSVNPGSGS